LPLADDKPGLYAVEGGVLSLSGPALQEFLRAVLDHGVPFRFSAHGMSMDPFIRDGDAITIVPLGSRQPRVGDVVAFCRPPDSRLVVHRVVGAGPFGFTVRGDANDTADGVVASQGVLGRMSVVHRRGRRVVVGSGPERLLLAHLSRRGMLRPLVLRTRRAVHRVRAALLGAGTTPGGETRA
jgi:signal peptidase I